MIGWWVAWLVNQSVSLEARDNLVIYEAVMLLYDNTSLLDFVSTLNTIKYGYHHCIVILTFLNCAVQRSCITYTVSVPCVAFKTM